MVGSSALKTDVGPRHSDLGQAGADRVLAGDERGAAGRAALLAVVVGEGRAFVGDAVDVGRAVAHLAAVVVADVPPADVVAPEDEDVRLAGFSHLNLPSLVALKLDVRTDSLYTRRSSTAEKANDADEDQEDCDREDRRLHSLLCHSGDRGERFRPAGNGSSTSTAKSK